MTSGYEVLVGDCLETMRGIPDESVRGDYYNDFDPGAAAWLRELINGGYIPAGQVDDRSILDVAADDLAGFRRCHFFAGIAGWSEALRLAGWPDAIPVWTGSPPCQPFSAAGKRGGRDDARHIGPRFVELVRAARPPVLFGEQVASADVFGPAARPSKRGAARAPAWAWLDDLFARLEAAGYAAWASDIPAAGIGAPHIRQRCFFCAVDLRFYAGGVEHGAGDGRIERRAGADGRGAVGGCRDGGLGNGSIPRPQGQRRNGATGGLAISHGGQRERLADGEGRQPDRTTTGRQQGDGQPAASDLVRGMADADLRGREPRERDARVCAADAGAQSAPFERGPVLATDQGQPRPTNGFWGSADWLFCRDERWRQVEPGTFPLAHGLSGRVGLLRGYGNAIVPQAAAEFIDASREILIETGIWAELRRAAA